MDPVTPPPAPLEAVLQIRVTTEMHRALNRLAGANGLSASAFLRVVIDSICSHPHEPVRLLRTVQIRDVDLAVPPRGED